MIFNVGDRIMNTYVYHTTAGYVMIDTGYEHSLASVEKSLSKQGVDLLDIKYIFLTHAHDDHAGFLRELLGENRDLKVIANPLSLTTLKCGQNSFEGGCSTLFAWIFCKLMALVGNAEHRFSPIDDNYDDRFIFITDENIDEIENLLGGKILFTPGHTSDSISLIVDDIVFCGDAAMNGVPSTNRLIIWIENLDDFAKSWDKLISSGAKMIYPAHGKPFATSDLDKYKDIIPTIKLRKLK